MSGGMNGKVCVVTGATSGIGLMTAQALAAMGARLVLVGRDRTRGELSVKIVDKRTTGGRTSIHYGDLSAIAEMKRVAAGIAAAEPRIDVLINCAGPAFRPRAVTVDGIEKTFALNHLSYFVLSNLLLPNLRAAASRPNSGARIISVASEAHGRATLDFDVLMFETDYNGLAAYGKSKLANILFTRELARRIEGTGVTANVLHPGFVNTRIGDNVGGISSFIFNLLKFLWARPISRGAETPGYLASSPDVAGISGQYFSDCQIARPSRAAEDDAAARRLWEESVRFTGVGG